MLKASQISLILKAQQQQAAQQEQEQEKMNRIRSMFQPGARGVDFIRRPLSTATDQVNGRLTNPVLHIPQDSLLQLYYCQL